MSRSSNRLPTSFRVLSAITTLFGSAMPCKRAARFGVSPTMACSCEAPEPIKSPTIRSMFGEHAGLGGYERGGGLGSSGGRATDNYLAQQDRDQDRAQDQDDDQALVDQ